jgi:Zn-dependent protease
VYPNRPERAGREPVLLRVGRFFGVPLYFAPSWILIATLITVLYSSIVRELVNGIGVAASYLAAFGFAVALALCVLAHELGHTAVSLALGKPVRRVVIFLLGGVSEIEGEMERARDELLISLAGPFVSALIAGLSAAAALFTHSGSLAAALLSLMFWSNVVVAVFNLLPGLPLDGGRVLRALTWSVSRSWATGTKVAGWAGRLIAVGLVLASILLVTDGFGAVRLGDLLRPGLLVHADVSVAEALRRTRELSAGGIIVTDSNEHPSAIVEESRVRALPFDRQAWTNVGELARRLEPGLILPETLGASELIAAMRATPANEYLIVRRDGSLAGVLTTSDLAAALGGQR